MRKLLLMTLVLLPIISSAAFDDDFINQTLRIDYIHSGNASTEFFALDQLIREPFWDRSRTSLTDPFNFGKYRFQALDSASGTLLYSYHYANLFNEWETTEEAKTLNRSFHETVIMPFPKRSVRLEFYSRNKQNVWVKKLEFFVNPDSYFIQPEARMPFPANCFIRSGDPSQRLDVVFLPEGYSRKEMRKFQRDANRIAGYFLGAEPFKSSAGKINFWRVDAPSTESGTDNPGQGVYKKTSLNSSFYTFNIERYLTTTDNRSIRDMAANAPYDQIVILVNTDKYGGGGFYNTYSLTSADNRLTNYVTIHEFGHALAGLGDEYYTSDVAVQDFYPAGIEPWEPNLTTLTDFGSKWKNMMDASTPIPTPATEDNGKTLGVYEGGGYAEKGVYRPMMDCTMKSTRYDSFCPVCNKAITEVIEFYSK